MKKHFAPITSESQKSDGSSLQTDGQSTTTENIMKITQDDDTKKRELNEKP
jgi:hypothetical protein